ncbi:MAG: hypothetical protein IIX36_01890, partial [Clostridia bacterium]|nr:hypothetical protein [Clostridia bacterium]
MNTDSKASEVKEEMNEAAKEEKKLSKKELRLKKKEERAKKKIPENETEEERKEREKKEEAKKRAKPKDIKAATKRLSAYITKYKVLLIIVALLVVLTTVTSVVASLFMIPVYEILEQAIKGNADGAEALSEIIRWLVIMAIFYIVSAVCNLAYTRIMLHVSTHTLKNMRRDLFNHIQTLPLEFFDK